MNNTSFLNGLLDKTAVYNRAVTLSEIEGIYRAGSAGKCSVRPVPIPTPTPIPTPAPSLTLSQAIASQQPDFSYTYLITGQGFGSLSGYHFLEVRLNGETVTLVQNGTPVSTNVALRAYTLSDTQLTLHLAGYIPNNGDRVQLVFERIGTPGVVETSSEVRLSVN